MPKLGARMVKKAVGRSPMAIGARDAAMNRRWCEGQPESLLVRHPVGPWFYRQFLDWLGLNFPHVRRRFELAMLGPARTIDPSQYKLLVPWLQDPIQAWSARAYEQACALAGRYEAQSVPVINHPAALVNAAKSRFPAMARGPDVRVARAARLSSPADLRRAAAEWGCPIIIRPDWGHGRRVVRIDTSDQCEAADDRLLAAIGRPVAIEFIDTRSADGLFRKYRYLSTARFGVNVHLIASSHWEVRGDNKVVNDALCAEERAFISQPNPHADQFEQLRQSMGLDLVAFDYAYDRSGTLVVWEGNPYPRIVFGSGGAPLAYRQVPVHRCFAAMAALYLCRAGLDIPAEIANLVDDPANSAIRCEALARPQPLTGWSWRRWSGDVSAMSANT